MVDSKYQEPGKIEPLGTKWHPIEGRFKLIENQKKSLSSTLKFTPEKYFNTINNLKQYYKI